MGARYVVVATMWTGAVIYTPLREAPPPDEYMAPWLDKIARSLAPENGGVKPVVRVAEQMPSLVPVVVPDAELPEETPPGGYRPEPMPGPPGPWNRNGTTRL